MKSEVEQKYVVIWKAGGRSVKSEPMTLKEAKAQERRLVGSLLGTGTFGTWIKTEEEARVW